MPLNGLPILPFGTQICPIWEGPFLPARCEGPTFLSVFLSPGTARVKFTFTTKRLITTLAAIHFPVLALVLFVIAMDHHTILSVKSFALVQKMLKKMLRWPVLISGM
ncbi:hypothetical protein [Neptuniibacter halophilus]|uniref:hypothetical protein n=1 Tax=Neptuniibacter halophilus TaxID=651666 RepID=UPI0025737829|nr:hypothetical protein [Neptuniibacter halophilus]